MKTACPTHLTPLAQTIFLHLSGTSEGVTRTELKLLIREDISKTSGFEIDHAVQELMGSLPGHSKKYVVIENGRYHLADVLFHQKARTALLECIPDAPQGECSNYHDIVTELTMKRKLPQEVVLSAIKELRDSGLIRDAGNGVFLKTAQGGAR
jgi:hypothetical protein